MHVDCQTRVQVDGIERPVLTFLKRPDVAASPILLLISFRRSKIHAGQVNRKQTHPSHCHRCDGDCVFLHMMIIGDGLCLISSLCV